MKKLFILAFAATFAVGSACAQQPMQRPNDSVAHPHHQHDGQHHGQHRGPHHGGHHGQKPPMEVPPTQYNADGIDMAVVDFFPAVKNLKQEGKWTGVYDATGQLLGYVVYSKPASDGIKGFNGETPVMIAFDVKKKIAGVCLLPNVETPGFAQRVKDAGLYSQWNGLSVKKARKKQVDTVSGATFTSRAVVQSVQAVLATL